MDSYEKSLQTLELPSVLALLAAQAVSFLEYHLKIYVIRSL